MASRTAACAVKATPASRSRKSKASKDSEEAPVASEGQEESAVQATQVEDEQIAADIKNTTSKLEELKDADGGFDRWSRSFLKTLTADKDRVMAELEAGKASMAEDKNEYNDLLLTLVASSLAPIVPGAGLAAGPIEPNNPLRFTQVTAVGQPLHQHTLLLLEESKALLEAFNGVAGRDPGGSHLYKLADDFRYSCGYTRKLFAAGRKVGKSEIEDMLADKYNEIRGRRALSKDEEEMGKLVFDNASGLDGDVIMADSEGWGKVACKAVRAAQKMEAVMIRH